MVYARPAGVVTLLTDFGLRDPYVGVMKGAVLRSNPKAVLVDLGHELPPQDVASGAFALAAAVGRFPSGTVHVAVVDPGVGTARRLLAVAAHEAFWLAPDNGLLSDVLAADPGAEARAVDCERLGLVAESRTFHGRDLFAPIAGWLAGGRYGFGALGPRITDPVRLAVAEAAPRVEYEDRFGNLVTNVAAAALAGIRAVAIAGVEVPLVGTYADVVPGAPLALVGSFGRLEVAVRDGSAARTLGAGRGAALELLR